MKQGDFELADILKGKNKPLCFIDLFPIFKDIILGLIYMHLWNLTHRDIKP